MRSPTELGLLNGGYPLELPHGAMPVALHDAVHVKVTFSKSY